MRHKSLITEHSQSGQGSMRMLWVWAVALLGCAMAVAQTPASAPATCTKTITFAGAENGQPVPAIPKFAAKWIGKSKHVEGYPDMCLSQMPSSRTANYIVIFSTNESSFNGLTAAAHTYSSSGPLSGDGTGVNSYGGMWTYSYSSTLPQTATSSLDLQHIDASKKALILHAYDQQGRQVSHYVVDSDHNREKILEQVMADIHRDVVEKIAQKRVAAPLSVYYVNCDVDSTNPQLVTASAEHPAVPPDTKPTPSPAPPPTQATLELLSNPLGADIYLDDKYVGKSPSSVTVAPGEHNVIMRKTDYGTWGRKLQVVAGPRRVNAYLEQKFLTLPSSQPQTAQRPTQPRVTQPQASRPQAVQPKAGVAGQ